MLIRKFLPPEIASNPEERRRFENEIHVVASLKHPHIAQVYAVEESTDLPMVVTEYIAGIDLNVIIEEAKENPIPMADIIRYAIQVADGLYAAHKSDVIHGNLKSHNIILDETGNIKLIDFGLSALNRSSSNDLEKYLKGALGYISPEQLNGELVDQRTDLWSYGVVLYELITGEPPFQGTYASAIIYAIINEQIPPILNFCADFPSGLEILLINLLQRDVDRRITSFNLAWNF